MTQLLLLPYSLSKQPGRLFTYWRKESTNRNPPFLLYQINKDRDFTEFDSQKDNLMTLELSSLNGTREVNPSKELRNLPATIIGRSISFSTVRGPSQGPKGSSTLVWKYGQVHDYFWDDGNLMLRVYVSITKSQCSIPYEGNDSSVWLYTSPLVHVLQPFDDIAIRRVPKQKLREGHELLEEWFHQGDSIQCINNKTLNYCKVFDPDSSIHLIRSSLADNVKVKLGSIYSSLRTQWIPNGMAAPPDLELVDWSSTEPIPGTITRESSETVRAVDSQETILGNTSTPVWLNEELPYQQVYEISQSQPKTNTTHNTRDQNIQYVTTKQLKDLEEKLLRAISTLQQDKHANTHTNMQEQYNSSSQPPIWIYNNPQPEQPHTRTHNDSVQTLPVASIASSFSTLDLPPPSTDPVENFARLGGPNKANLTTQQLEAQNFAGNLCLQALDASTQNSTRPVAPKTRFNPDSAEQLAHQRIINNVFRGKPFHHLVSEQLLSAASHFYTIPSTFTALFSWSFGNGLSIASFKPISLEDKLKLRSDSSVNLQDFSHKATKTKHRTLHSLSDVDDAISTLLVFGERWWNHVPLIILRKLRSFVQGLRHLPDSTKFNMDYLTFYIDDILTDIGGALRNFTTTWWEDVLVHLQRFDYNHPTWIQYAVTGILFTRDKRQRSETHQPSVAAPKKQKVSMTDEIASSVPKENGKELCLLYISKKGCSSRDDTCKYGRAHFSPRALPGVLLDYVKDKFGGLRNDFRPHRI